MNKFGEKFTLERAMWHSVGKPYYEMPMYSIYRKIQSKFWILPAVSLITILQEGFKPLPYLSL